MNSGRLVLDTNIVSYLMRGSRVANVYKPHLEGRLLAISFITVGEFYFGAEKARWGEKRRQRLEQTLRKFLVIPYDIEIARCYGRLVAERQGNGNPISSNDGWIAACAVRHSVPLVTHNSRHFDDISGLEVITEV